MGLSNLFGDTQPMQSIPGTQPLVDSALADDTALVEGIAETREPVIGEPTYTESEISVGVEPAQRIDSTCPPGYKPVVIYVPTGLSSTDFPALPIAQDGRIEPSSEASPEVDFRRDQLPWLNPELFQFENGYDPYIGIRPEGQELPGSIQYDDVPSGEIQVPAASQGWWENMMNRFQQTPLAEKLQEAINEKRAERAQEGVEAAADQTEYEADSYR